MSPHPKPPPPLPHSPGVPVPPPDSSNAPTFHSVTTTFPSFPHIEVPVPDPTPRSRTPRRDTDPPFPTLIPESHPAWVQQAGVTPVGAPGTTPLRPPGIAVDPTSDPSLSMDHRDIRDYNPIDPDIAKGKGKGKGKPADKGKGRAKKDKVKDQAKEKANLKAKKTVPPPLLLPYMPQQPKGKARNNSTTYPPSHYLFSGPACHCGRSRLTALPSSPLHLLTHMARLVIVAGPAFRPTSPIHFHPIFIPNHQSFPHSRPGLSLWQVPPHPYPPTSSSPSLPSFSLSGFPFLRHMTRFATVASLTLPHLSLPLKGPACHCGRSRLISSFYPSHLPGSPSPLLLSLSPLAAPRAPAAMGDPK